LEKAAQLRCRHRRAFVVLRSFWCRIVRAILDFKGSKTATLRSELDNDHFKKPSAYFNRSENFWKLSFVL